MTKVKLTGDYFEKYKPRNKTVPIWFDNLSDEEKMTQEEIIRATFNKLNKFVKLPNGEPIKGIDVVTEDGEVITQYPNEVPK